MNPNYQLRWQQFARCLLDDLIHHPCPALPGLQVLGRQYKVGRATVEKALSHMEDLGVIEPVQHGKRRQVNLAKLREIAALQGQVLDRILFLTKDPAGNPAYMTREYYSIAHELGEREHFAVDYVQLPSSLNELRRLLIETRPRGVILYVVPDAVVELVVSCGIPAVAMGSIHPQLPSFFTGYAALLVQAFQQAAAVGHHRIMAPLWNKETELCQRLAGHLQQNFPGGKAAFSKRYNLPNVAGETPEDYHAALRELFRYTPPTCIIFGNLHQYLMGVSFFLKEGLRVPGDLSIILLSHDPYLEDVSPSVAHFAHCPEDTMIQVFHALKEQMRGLQSFEQTSIACIWVAGGSLIPPKA